MTDNLIDLKAALAARELEAAEKTGARILIEAAETLVKLAPLAPESEEARRMMLTVSAAIIGAIASIWRTTEAAPIPERGEE